MSGHEKLHIAAARRNRRRRSMPVEGFAASNVTRLPLRTVVQVFGPRRGGELFQMTDFDPDSAA